MAFSLQPVTGAGTAGTPDANVLTIQGIAGGTTINVLATIGPTPSVNVNTLPTITVAAITATPSVNIASALPAGTANIGFVTPTPSTTGGWSKAVVFAVTNAARNIKSSAGTFGGYYIYNPNSTVAYLQVYDHSLAVTVGTTSPSMSYAIPPLSAANLELTLGVNMTASTSIAATTVNTGGAAPTSNLDVTIYYK